ncbi:helix-turn-helix domain-containing protein [Sporolactobacillus kofuensis]|uniref:Helix-turn-helix domain-containing protein n=1 Tax=Sporolactobacillus kofuensis TaxID=269672 RepID=A0ABW1WEI0_9BACL|nr:helix-turn-helix domain-containing protein [Sporolactobacillus kofuensis]MCO7175802.1 helix-turn-helix domain-containing protein [Sporolactobacillus kofuensis]
MSRSFFIVKVSPVWLFSNREQYSVKEIVEMTGISRATVYRYVNQELIMA